MDLFDVIKVAARRWYVTLPILLIAVYIAYGSYSSVKPVYYTSVSIGLVSPSVKQQQPVTSGEPTIVTSNGLAESGGIGLLANLLSLSLTDGGARSQVVALGGSSSYEAKVFTLPSSAQLPIVVVSASGADKERVENTVTLAAQQAAPVLQGVQAAAGVPPEQMVTAFPLSNVPEAYGALPGRTREAGAILVGGLIVAMVAAVLTDALIKSLLASRRARKRKGQPVGPQSQAPSPSVGVSANGHYEKSRSGT